MLQTFLSDEAASRSKYCTKTFATEFRDRNQITVNAWHQKYVSQIYGKAFILYKNVQTDIPSSYVLNFLPIRNSVIWEEAPESIHYWKSLGLK